MSSDDSTAGSTTPTRPLRNVAALSGLVAAVATSAIAALGDLAGVSLDVDGEPIPVVGFAVVTLVAVAVGFVLAVALMRWARRPRRAFVATTLVLVAASIVPDLTTRMSTGTTILLMTAHLTAAAIVVPSIVARLPAGR